MKIKAILRENIKAKRKQLGLTQAELAESIDVSVPTIQYAERDSDDWPSLATLQKLAVFFKCEEHELFQLPQEPKEPPPQDTTLDQIKELLASKKPDASHIPEEFLNLAKNLPLSAKDNWESVIDHLNFEIEEYQTELGNGPRQYVTKEDIVKKEQEALSRPRFSDPLAGKHKL